MHYANLVLLSPDSDIEKEIESLMNEYVRHDYYLIGGRYSGRINGKTIARVEDLTEEILHTFFRIVSSYGIFGGEYWKPWKGQTKEAWQVLDMPSVEWIKENMKNYYAVSVDNHN